MKKEPECCTKNKQAHLDYFIETGAALDIWAESGNSKASKKALVAALGAAAAKFLAALE